MCLDSEKFTICINSTIIEISDSEWRILQDADWRIASFSGASFGTGWPISAGYVITNHHVMDSAAEIFLLDASGLQDDPASYQTTVPIQPGNSGGPLLNMSGEVVGVVRSMIGIKHVQTGETCVKPMSTLRSSGTSRWVCAMPGMRRNASTALLAIKPRLRKSPTSGPTTSLKVVLPTKRFVT